MSLLQREEKGLETLISGSVLLAEDNMNVAADTKTILESMGAKEVIVSVTEADSLSVLDAHDITLAVLDIKLQSQVCLRLAQRCLDENIRFIFATGYGSHPFDIKRFGNVPIVVKPYRASQIARAIREAQTDDERLAKTALT